MKNIQSITFVHGLEEVNYLGVISQNDNLIDSAYLVYTLYNKTVIAEDGDTPESINVVQIYSGTVTLAGSDYTSWNGDNNYPYNFVAEKLSLTII